MEELLLNAARNFGVPSVIAFYVLFSVNVTLEGLTKVIYKLSAEIDTRFK